MKNRLCAKILVMVLLICCVLLTSMPAMAEWKPVRYCLSCKSAANFVEFRKYSRDRHDLWYRCTSCNLLQSLALEMHTLEQHEGKVPTCTEYGWNPYVTCDACGYTTYESLNKDPNNHDLVEHEGKAPTCMEYGWDPYQTCTRCDYSTYKKLPVQHDLVHHEGKEWSCTEKGWLPYDTCNLCDYSTYRLVGPHFGELVAPKEPTCTEIGWLQYIKCSRCDSILSNSYIELPASGHVPEANKSVVTKPTCTEDGYTTHTCSVCKVTYTADVVKAPGHSYKSVVTEPTCTEDGYTTYTCSVCEYTYTGDNVSELKHDPKQHEAQAPTCTEIGWDAYETCKREGCNYTTYEEISALKHDPEQHEAQAPTCTEIGWDAYETCKREGCNYTTYEEISALKHDPEQHEAQAPTCTEIGWDAYETCKREGCTYTTYAELSIDPSNHDLVHHDAQAPNCTEVGWNAYDTCTRCDYTTYQEIPALKHDYQAEIFPRTCQKDGYTLHTCTRCKDSYADTVVSHCGHWYGEWTSNGDSTHSAECRRGGCKHKGRVKCEMFDYRLLSVDAENYAFAFCPVCGTVNDGAHLALIDASVEILSGRIPYGEPVLRLGALQNSEKLLSVGFEYGGRLYKASCKVKITLPAALVKGYALHILAVDGTETELTFTVTDDMAIFTLNFDAQDEPPVRVLHLVPVQ